MLDIEPEKERRPSAYDSHSLQGQSSTGQNSLGTSFNPCSRNWDPINISPYHGWKCIRSIGCAHNWAWEVIQRVFFTLKDTSFNRQSSTPVQQTATQLRFYSQVSHLAGCKKL